ncbi:MAG: hypothetical protein JST89_14710 [Cyanobacteria bacterium SZAS-4]|nr:hypothetical protein [Cyanobacteria bacterium SZAS-4]
MVSKSIPSNDDWFKSFFSGAALDLWRQAKTEDKQNASALFYRKPLVLQMALIFSMLPVVMVD